jgi:hypothetical protein
LVTAVSDNIEDENFYADSTSSKRYIPTPPPLIEPSRSSYSSQFRKYKPSNLYSEVELQSSSRNVNLNVLGQIFSDAQLDLTYLAPNLATQVKIHF